MIICNLNHNKHDTSYYIAWVWDSFKRDWPSLFNASTEKNWNDKRDIIKANNPFKPIPSLNWGQESLTKDFSSSNVENTMDLMDLTIQDIMSIPNEKLCEQVKIAEYLKPKALTEANTGISNAEKAQLLDFYNNTTLIKPCIGEEIDKDEIFSGLCASGEMSLAGLNAALDGVDYITKEQKNKIENILDGIDLDINDLCEDGPEYELNSCEKLLLNRYPSAKMGLLASGYAAQQWTDFKFGYNGRNDCSDAFRHALLNALSTFYLGADIAKEFGDAHECDNTPDLHLEGEMDLHNNAMGRSIYNSLPKPNNGALPTHVISAEICERLENGDLKVFSVPSNNQSPLVPSNNCKCN